jgi:hypothetical protein
MHRLGVAKERGWEPYGLDPLASQLSRGAEPALSPVLSSRRRIEGLSKGVRRSRGEGQMTAAHRPVAACGLLGYNAATVLDFRDQWSRAVVCQAQDTRHFRAIRSYVR